MEHIQRGFWAVSLATLFSMAVGCGGGSAPLVGGGVAKEPSGPVAENAPLGDVSQGGPGQTAPPPPQGQASGVQFDMDGAAKGGAAPSSAPPSRMAQDEARRPSRESPAEPTNRPGLGTQWGETRSSSITTVPFQRADATNPFSMGSLFYNDEEGARAMANAVGFRRTAGGVSEIAGGALLVGLRDENGAFLNGFVAGEKNFVVGEAGRRYTIVIRNRTPNRIECVVSVDGLDVIDGKSAAFQKRGYLVQPHGELEIDGFRQTVEAVAAFRFGSVRGSYANQKHGDTRNVGVIGFAFFHERGTDPFAWSNDEARRRNNANPFPGQFATPP